MWVGLTNKEKGKCRWAWVQLELKQRIKEKYLKRKHIGLFERDSIKKKEWNSVQLVQPKDSSIMRGFN
jgi:hypothetical protein